MTDQTPKPLPCPGTPLPWQSQGLCKMDEGIAIIGVIIGDDGEPLFTPTNGLVAYAMQWPTEIDEGDFTRAEANAAYIVTAANSYPSLTSAIAALTAERGALIASHTTDIIRAVAMERIVERVRQLCIEVLDLERVSAAQAMEELQDALNRLKPVLATATTGGRDHG